MHFLSCVQLCWDATKNNMLILLKTYTNVAAKTRVEEVGLKSLYVLEDLKILKDSSRFKIKWLVKVHVGYSGNKIFSLRFESLETHG